MSTAKTQKAELKVYLDHLRDIVRPDCQAIGRELTHDIYEIFKSVKRPEKETVYVNVPSDDKADKLEIERLKNQLAGIKGNLKRSQDEIAKHQDQLRLAKVAGVVAGLRQNNHKKDEADRSDLFGSVMAVIVAAFASETTWDVVRTVCEASIKIVNELSAGVGSMTIPAGMSEMMVENLRDFCNENELPLPPQVNF